MQSSTIVGIRRSTMKSISIQYFGKPSSKTLFWFVFWKYFFKSMSFCIFKILSWHCFIDYYFENSFEKYFAQHWLWTQYHESSLQAEHHWAAGRLVRPCAARLLGVGGVMTFRLIHGWFITWINGSRWLGSRRSSWKSSKKTTLFACQTNNVKTHLWVINAVSRYFC